MWKGRREKLSLWGGDKDSLLSLYQGWTGTKKSSLCGVGIETKTKIKIKVFGVYPSHYHL